MKMNAPTAARILCCGRESKLWSKLWANFECFCPNLGQIWPMLWDVFGQTEISWRRGIWNSNMWPESNTVPFSVDHLDFQKGTEFSLDIWSLPNGSWKDLIWLELLWQRVFVNIMIRIWFPDEPPQKWCWKHVKTLKNSWSLCCTGVTQTWFVF